MKEVSFTPNRAKQFANFYNKAKKEDAKSFMFNGDEYVVSYAYYVIEYLKMNNIIKGKFNDNKTFSYE